MNKVSGLLIVLLDQSIGDLQMDGDHVVGIDLWPGAKRYLDRLTEQGHAVTLIIIKSIAETELEAIRKSLPSFSIAAGSSLETLLDGIHIDPSAKTTVFVSLDRVSRELAVRRFNLNSLPHIGAAEWVLEGRRLSFAKILSRRRPDVKNAGLLPYYVEGRGDEWLILGLLTDSALLRMVRSGAEVDLLPFDYHTGDCGFLRIDSPNDVNNAHWEGTSFLASDKNRLLLAFFDAGLIGATAPPSAHGALEMLTPSPELLNPARDPSSYTRRAVGLASALSERSPDLVEASAVPVPIADLFFALPDAATFKADAERYSGLAPLGASGPIISRHIRHPDNLRAVNTLADDLSALGYCTHKHSFVHNGQTLYNVIADMPGRGYFQIKPEILKKLLEILRKYPYPWPWPKIEKELVLVLGKGVVEELKRHANGPLRLGLEELIGAYRWLPWWKLRDHIVGFGAQIVIVGCHLDSSAERTAGGYNPAVDPAPGMDDNASGIAACLAAARYLIAFKGHLVHTVRFCFFNAEEAGLVGSKAYAASLKSLNAPVRAVICADMLGYNSDGNLIFEIHAGYSDPAIRDRNLPIASKVGTWASSLGALQPAQIYQGTSSSAGAPDRNLYDPAINRSDHGAFHQQGFPAVAVSEDYFANLATEPGKDPNPNYHTANDKAIDAAYGAAIASAVACAAKELAEI